MEIHDTTQQLASDESGELTARAGGLGRTQPLSERFDEVLPSGNQMTDYALARDNMIESQVRPNGVTDQRILSAMATLAREDFVPETRRAVAYADDDVEIAPGRVMIEAMALARLVQLAEIKPEDKVLHIGAASGYGTAVIAALAQSVVALECDGTLAALCRRSSAPLANVQVVEGSLELGSPRNGPYDAVVVEGRVAEIPQPLLSQLADGGRLVAVVGESDMAKAQVWTAHGGKAAVRQAFDAAVAELPGFARKRPAFVF
jgi:protein-L-isoaspartate(D-aspartate) O-methyltransferase